ncbi:MAG: erythromycin esterase family protein [Methanothrix sp.]|nr:erythromycin esterase family protein [Methanothrix sp.]MDD4446699.1 erythromycin esterase family protein [Methanothrix sp.]
MDKSSSLQNSPAPVYATLDEWIKQDAIPFSLDSAPSLDACVDRLIASLDPSLKLLGLGEALHGGEDILMLRNLLFSRLVEKHGYSAIAVESSFPRARAVNEYVAGRGPASYDALQEAGFSHGFGRLKANRELVEWMRAYNADGAHRIKLRFYGFDSPTEMMYSDSPRQILYFLLDYLASIDCPGDQEQRLRIDRLLGQDSDWENPAATMDPEKSIGLSPAAKALRIEVEDLIAQLQVRRPELVAKSGKNRYLEAMQYATLGRQLLNYHAALAQKSDPGERIVQCLGLRDAMMADNLAYVVSQECSQGRVLAFAHNSHLQRGKAEWQLGSNQLAWWPAGAHLSLIFGPSYVVIGTAVGVSHANGIGQPQDGTLEARLTGTTGPGRFIPTYNGQGLSASEIAALPERSASTLNSTYFALTPQSFTDFDWLAVLNSSEYTRGGPELVQRGK